MVTRLKVVLLGFSLFIEYCLIDRRSYRTSLISNKTFFFFFACLDMFNFVKLLESKDCPDLQRLYPSCISVSLDADKVLVTKVLGRTFTQAFLRSCISTRFSQLQGGIFVFRNCMSPNAFC